MANKPLTKEQKMDILSQAIDAGAHIDINFQTTLPTVAPVKELEEILSGMKGEPSAGSYERSRWIQYSDGGRLDFRGVIFLPQSTPAEWKDTGDVEEVAVE